MKKILKFKASWCGPCKVLSSTLSKITTDIPIEEVDIEQNSTLTQQYNIRGVPTLVMVEDDVEMKRVVGVKSLEELQTWINN